MSDFFVFDKQKLEKLKYEYEKMKKKELPFLSFRASKFSLVLQSI